MNFSSIKEYDDYINGMHKSRVAMALLIINAISVPFSDDNNSLRTLRMAMVISLIDIIDELDKRDTIMIDMLNNAVREYISNFEAAFGIVNFKEQIDSIRQSARNHADRITDGDSILSSVNFNLN